MGLLQSKLREAEEKGLGGEGLTGEDWPAHREAASLRITPRAGELHSGGWKPPGVPSAEVKGCCKRDQPRLLK